MTRSPEVYWSRPPMMFSRVVFPQPEGPRMDTNSLSPELEVHAFQRFHWLAAGGVFLGDVFQFQHRFW